MALQRQHHLQLHRKQQSTREQHRLLDRLWNCPLHPQKVTMERHLPTSQSRPHIVRLRLRQMSVPPQELSGTPATVTGSPALLMRRGTSPAMATMSKDNLTWLSIPTARS